MNRAILKLIQSQKLMQAFILKFEDQSTWFLVARDCGKAGKAMKRKVDTNKS